MEVTVEDQQKINTFSQLNTRKHELEDMLRVKAVRGPSSERALLCFATSNVGAAIHANS